MSQGGVFILRYNQDARATLTRLDKDSSPDLRQTILESLRLPAEEGEDQKEEDKELVDEQHVENEDYEK